MPSGHEIADALARAVGGRVHALPTDDKWWRIVVLVDGRVPLLVRDFGHTLGVCLVGERGWQDRPANFIDAVVQEVVVATQAWAKAESRERATMFECAAVLAEFLAAHTGGPWTVSIPGVVVPAELWLRPREGSASVGVFADAVRVWNGDQSLERVLVIRTDLESTSSSMRAIALAVDGQLAAYARNLDLCARIEAVSEHLAARLEPRLGECTRQRTGLPSHASTIQMSLGFVGRGEVRVFARDNHVIVEAGLVGEQGWSDSSEVVDDTILAAIEDALARARRSLTIHSLEVGREYEVREDLQELQAGMIVRFDGFDDIDNHYGRYEFTSRDGRRVTVSGDFSRPRQSPLGEAHRYLKELDS